MNTAGTSGKIKKNRLAGDDASMVKLEISQTEYQLLADSLPLLVWTARPDGTVDYYNKRAKEFSGIVKLGGAWTWQPAVHPDDAKRTLKAWEQAVKSGSVYQIEHRIKMKDGSYRWMLSRSEPMRDKKGNILRWYGTATDIHEQKTFEELLGNARKEAAENEKRFRAVFRQAPLAIVISRRSDGRIYDVNNAFTEMLGYEREEVINRTTLEINAFADPEVRKKIADAITRTGNLKPTEYQYRRKDGKICTGILSAAIVKTGNEDLVIAETYDVSKEKDAIEELQKSRNQLDAILKTVADGVIVYDDAQNILFVNEPGARYCGFSSTDELMETQRLPSLLSEVSERVEIRDESGIPVDNATLPSRRMFEGKLFAYAKLNYFYKNSGEDCWLSVKSSPFLDKEGKLRMVVTTFSDITDQKKTEQSLEENRKKIERAKREWETTFDSLSDMILITDSKGIIRRCNRATSAHLKLPYMEIIGKDIRSVFHDGSADFNAGEFEFEDSKQWFSVSVYPFSPSGKLQGKVYLFKDITALKKLDARKSEFLGIAGHELRTPITGLKLYTQILNRKLRSEGDSQALEFLDRINTQLDKLSELINDLLDFTRLEEGRLHLKKTWFKIDDLISEIADQFQQTQETHDLVVEGMTGLDIYADKERIAQVVTNLISNAISYSPDADKVIIRISGHEDIISVSVHDFGIGIPKDKQDKLFNRFYRVEGDNNPSGLGLGLYISSEIVKRHQGEIKVESEPGKGSTFSIVLPINAAEA